MVEKTPILIVVLGPTASGKSDLAMQLADSKKISIHNADSRQVYKGMDIGTAKPSLEQLKKIEHHLIDIRDPDKPMNLHEFHKEAKKSLESKFSSVGMALLVGGSGLYIKAITKGLKPPAVGPQNHLRNQLKTLGQYTCHELLKKSDPIAAKKISKTDEVRTQRALEVLYATGKPISMQRKFHPPSWKIIELGLDPKDLSERIKSRTIKMFSNGLIEETQKLIALYGQDLSLLQTIGYNEALKVIKGEFNLEEAIQMATLRTQKFAKRQRTWFRKQHAPHWLNDQEPLREALSLIETDLV